MKTITFILALFFSCQSFSQAVPHTNADSAATNADSGTVIIHRDPRLDLLVKKQAQINEDISRDSRKAGKGFRLMIISTVSRDEAIAAKSTIYTYFPELKAYLWHQAPYYKLKAGNFKDRKEAEDYQKKLNVYFPKGVFIMNDVVELKPDRGGDDNLQ